MNIFISEQFTIPSATPQQRKLGGKGTHPTEGLRLARATWQALMEKYRPARPMKGPVYLFVNLKYHTKRKLKTYQEPKTTRPDGDNLLKIIKDAATKAGWWLDDAQVYCEMITRHFVNDEEWVIIRAEEDNGDENL